MRGGGRVKSSPGFDLEDGSLSSKVQVRFSTFGAAVLF